MPESLNIIKTEAEKEFKKIEQEILYNIKNNNNIHNFFTKETNILYEHFMDGLKYSLTINKNDKIQELNIQYGIIEASLNNGFLEQFFCEKDLQIIIENCKDVFLAGCFWGINYRIENNEI